MATILMVDDDPGVRRVAKLILENAWHEVIEARDGAEALVMMGRMTSDLIVTELVMPDHEGIGLIREIRRSGNGVPVLAVSGSGPSGPAVYLASAVQLGANRALAKPFRARQLLDVVEEMLQERAKASAGG